MHKLPVGLCASWHSPHGTGVPVSSTSTHTQIQSCDSLGSGHTMVAALSWTLQEGVGSYAHPISLGTAPGCGGEISSQLSTASQGKHSVRPLCHKTLPFKHLFLTMTSNLFHGKQQSLKQVAVVHTLQIQSFENDPEIHRRPAQ